MNHRNKGKAKNIFAWSCPLLLILLTYHFTGYANFRPGLFNSFAVSIDTPPPIKAIAETLFLKPKEVIRKPGIREEAPKKVALEQVSVTDTFTFKRSKDSLTDVMVYHADDSLVVDVPKQKMYLYGKVSKVHYETNDLSAPQIEFDQRTATVSAFLKKDSSGKVISFPYYSQGSTQVVSDSIRFNMKSGKGITKGTYTKEGEMFVYGDKIKKADTNTIYAFGTRFTTCNLDTPHFAFIAKRAKFVSKKWAYTGPVHPEFEGVPLPIVLPFGIFPLTQGKHSGLLAPTFGANDQLGLSLENLGYYKIFSPNWDAVARATIYSYGSYTALINPRYYRRYHYQGNINLAFQKIHPLDQASNKTFRLDWSHNADTKARPGVNFTANVSVASSKYNSQVPNSPGTNFQNQLYSTISYSKDWKNKPFHLSVNATHNQNTVDGRVNLNLPDIIFTVNTQYPFRRKEPTGEYKWYENLGIAYNGAAKSLTYFYDTLGPIGKQAINNLQYGAQHSIPLTLSLPPLGVLQLSPTVSYEEKWYQQKLVRDYNPVLNKIDTLSLTKGFYTARQMSFGLSASTRIFGMFGFGKNSKIKAIRHEIRPSVSVNYSPNFNAKNYYQTRIDAFGNTQLVSFYENSIYGAYNNQRFGGLSFNIDNNVTAKVRNKSDTSAKADKKISLLDGLSLSGSYNFLADSFQVSTLALSARTNLTDKVNITANATFDPYEYNGATGARINKLVWSKKPLSLGNLLSGGVFLQSSFKGGDKSKNTTSSQNPLDPALLNKGVTLDEYQTEAAYIQNNPSEFVDFSIPWSVDLSYSLLFNRSFDILRTKFITTLTQGVQFNTSANLTERWKVGLNGSFDITTKQLGVLSGYLSRDLHCWQLGINVSPVGKYRFFSINLSPKSSILRDLKVNRTRSFNDF